MLLEPRFARVITWASTAAAAACFHEHGPFEVVVVDLDADADALPFAEKLCTLPEPRPALPPP